MKEDCQSTGCLLMDNKIVMTENREVILYGAATTGGILYKGLCKQGIYVKAFVDKRAHEIDKYQGIDVLSIEELNSISDKDDIVVIIAIKNVFEHEKIANLLFSGGFQNIIYRPQNTLEGRGTDNENELNKIYDYALEGKLTIGMSWSRKNRVTFPEVKDNALLCENGHMVSVRISAAFIYSDLYDNKELIWGDIPMYSLLPHLGLFRSYSGIRDDYKDLYLVFCHEAAARSGGIVTSKEWENSVLNNRLDVFQHMEYAWNNERDFFEKCAVPAKLNSKGYFNVVSGKHRAVFEIVKGARYIPLLIDRKQYNKWLRTDLVEPLYAFLAEKFIEGLKYPILHPWFYKFPSQAGSFYYEFIEKVSFAIYEDAYRNRGGFDFSNHSCLFYNSDIAVSAFVFSNMGYNVMIYEQDEQQKTLVGLEYELYTGHSTNFVEKFTDVSFCDIIICKIGDVYTLKQKLQVRILIAVGDVDEQLSDALLVENIMKEIVFGYDGVSFKKVLWIEKRIRESL